MATECGLDKNGDAVVRVQGGGSLLRFERAETKDIIPVTNYIPFGMTMAPGDIIVVDLSPLAGDARALHIQAVEQNGNPIDVSFAFDAWDGSVYQPIVIVGSRLDLLAVDPRIPTQVKVSNVSVSIANVRGYAAA
jgi:hypothetical protein